MKKTALATKDAALLDTIIAKYGQVVTAAQIQAETRLTWGEQQTKNRIIQLTNNGWLIRIKRGLYAISDLSNRGFLSISPYSVAHLLVEESYVSFEAALAYHGMFDQYTDQYISVSAKQFRNVELGSIHYRFIKTKLDMFNGWEEHQVEGLAARIATAEKALVDLIHFRKNKLVVDLLIEKLQGHRDSLDLARLYTYTANASKITVKIFGLVFDLLGWNSSAFSELLGADRSTHYLSRDDQTFSKAWRIYYDNYFDRYSQGETKA